MNQQEFTPPFSLHTPVLFLVFNRLDTTKRVFEAIRKAKPPRLYVVADGPRENIDGDADKCRQVREIVTAVDWNCEVSTLFRDMNLGSAVGIGKAISWFFENVNEGIIIEDDCLPRESFFRFCEELLDKYRDDERIMTLSGTNSAEIWERCGASYFFSSYGTTWGWATWRRAWKHFDFNMNYLEKLIKCNLFHQLFPNKKEYRRKLRVSYLPDWDYKWHFAMVINSGLTIIPHKNLITNIGAGEDATHTKNLKIKKSHDLEFPLKHPFYVVDDKEYLKMRIKEKNKSYIEIIKNKIFKCLKSIFAIN